MFQVKVPSKDQRIEITPLALLSYTWHFSLAPSDSLLAAPCGPGSLALGITLTMFCNLGRGVLLSALR